MNTAYAHDPVLAVDWLQLILAAVLTLGLTSIVALVIRRPLFGVLPLVCGNDVGARFWTTFAAVLLVMGPLFLVFTAAGGATSLADFVRRAVYLVSFGVIGAFMVMGAAVMLSAPSLGGTAGGGDRPRWVRRTARHRGRVEAMEGACGR